MLILVTKILSSSFHFKDTECRYIMKADQGNRILLTFYRFQVITWLASGQTTKCFMFLFKEDYLQLSVTTNEIFVVLDGKFNFGFECISINQI